MVELIKGDITKIQVDAIVNAANTSLMGGSGVDGAIHKAGGPRILEECKRIRDRQGSCKVGEAVITTGGKLQSKYIIHAVGPVWNGGGFNEENLLAAAYRNSLLLALENQIETLAFPNISTGIYRFPKEKAATIAIETVVNFLKKADSIKKVIFICLDPENYTIYKIKLKISI